MTSMTDLKPVEELTFEEALEELEELTSSMASGEATLKESVAGYARGTALLKRCRRELEEARRIRRRGGAVLIPCGCGARQKKER